MNVALAPLLLAGWVLSLLGAPAAARACRYCEQSADPVEVMRFQGQGRKAAGGSFSPDDSLNTYVTGAPAPLSPVATALPPAPEPTPAVTPPPVLAAAPALPPVVATPAAAAAPPVPAEPPPAVVAVPPASPRHPSPAPPSARWADLGLLGLAILGGWFAWRTRAAARPEVA